MASTLKPKIYAFKQGGATAIPKGSAVKMGADNSHVSLCTASTDLAIGIAQSASTNAEDKIEVAMPGGGAKALAHGTVNVGQKLVPYTDGSLQPATGAGDQICAVALDSAVAGDIFSVVVQLSQAEAAG